MSYGAAPEALVSSASVSEQLAYWIAQTSTLSDSLIESQLRCSEAEAAAHRLLPLERSVPAMQAELRTLSEARASALVENARLSEWAESLRQLTHQQEAELSQLRALSAQQESAGAALSSQLMAARSAGSSLNNAVQLQQAYQTKLLQSENQLAVAQKEVAENATLKFNYQVLHAKYTALKRSQAGTGDLTGALQHENATYREQMAQVCSELEEVRRDILARESEREGLLTRMVSSSEAEQELRAQNQQLQGALTRLTHGMRMARARTFQQVDTLREFHSRIKREAEAMLTNERRNMHAVCSEVMAHLHRTQSRTNSTNQLMQAHMHKDREAHQAQMQHQDEKLMQLLQYSTGASATAMQLQQRRKLLEQSQQLIASHPSSLSASPALPATVAAGATANFDVRDWLSNQSKLNTGSGGDGSGVAAPAPAHPATPSHHNGSHVAALSRSGNRAPAVSVGQSPQAQLAQLRAMYDHSVGSQAPPLPPTFSLPSSVASSIHPLQHGGSQTHMHTANPPSLPPSGYPSHSASQISSAVPSHQPSPYLHAQAAPSSNLTAAALQAAAASLSQQRGWSLPGTNVATTAHNELSDHVRAQAQASQLTRTVHIQRLAEVEAALHAMEQAHPR